MNNQAIFWIFPVLVGVAILLQLYTGRLGLMWAPKQWLGVTKDNDEGRFWLFIVAEFLLLIVLIAQALSR
jgi:hypothetical protein